MADDPATLAALSDAVTGPTRNMHLRRPTAAAVWCQVGVLVLLGLYAGVIIAVLAWSPLPPPPGEEGMRRLWFLGWTGLLCVACMALVALSQFFSRVDASAAGGHLQLGDGSP